MSCGGSASCFVGHGLGQDKSVPLWDLEISSRSSFFMCIPLREFPLCISHCLKSLNLTNCVNTCLLQILAYKAPGQFMSFAPPGASSSPHSPCLALRWSPWGFLEMQTPRSLSPGPAEPESPFPQGVSQHRQSEKHCPRAEVLKVRSLGRPHQQHLDLVGEVGARPYLLSRGPQVQRSCSSTWRVARTLPVGRVNSPVMLTWMVGNQLP